MIRPTLALEEHIDPKLGCVNDIVYSFVAKCKFTQHSRAGRAHVRLIRDFDSGLLGTMSVVDSIQECGKTLI